MQEYNRNKSLVKRNILNYLNESGVSKYEFYKISGISRGTLDNTSGLTEENILRFFTYAPNVSPEWLLFGKGEMLKTTPEYSDVASKSSGTASEPRQEYGSPKVPVYNVRNAGAMIALLNHSADLQPENYIQIPNLGPCDGALYLSSDTMYPLLKSGDIVAYKIMKDKQNSIFWGEMYLLAIQVEAEEISMIGYVQKSEKGEEYIAVRSHNPQHEQKDIHLDQVLAFAHVKASVRMN